MYNTRAKTREKRASSCDREHIEIAQNYEKAKSESDCGEINENLYGIKYLETTINFKPKEYTIKQQTNSDKEYKGEKSDKTMNNNNEFETTENDSDLKSLIKLLTLKIQKDEEKNNSVNITVDTFTKIVPEFNGENIGVEQWFENFNKNANAYDLNSKQKYVQARNKITGAAKMYLDSVAISDYDSLQKCLTDEFKKNTVALKFTKC